MKPERQCNLVVKKYRRGFDGISEQRIGEELADVIIYVAPVGFEA